MLPLVLLRAFRCSHCEMRFYRFSLRDGLRRRGPSKHQEESGAVPDDPFAKQELSDLEERKHEYDLQQKELGKLAYYQTVAR